jgi:predicted O-linked N-acetylglucosamine transferase (SPINDLY family)
MAAYNHALALKPVNAETLYNRGNMQWLVHGNYAAALADLEKAAAIKPGHDYVLGELSYLRLHGGDWRDFEMLRAAITEGVRAGRRVVQPFHFQALSDSPADLQQCAVIFTRHHFPAAPALAPAGRAAGGRIRLGYVAGEFREHATAHLLAGLFDAHDRARFELVAFDNGWDDGSAMRQRLAGAFDSIIDISRLSNRAAAEQIRDQQIDILVNLNGYVGLHRMGVFAHRPAPVQVNYLGSPATSGADYMDYILADKVVIPPSDQVFYTEKVAYLPDSYQVNDARLSRADCGLPDDAIVFCSFNSSYKLTPEIFAVWTQILKSAPGSVLWLLESNPQFASNLRRAAVQAGLAETRLVFAPMIAPDRHLARLKLADLFLDLLPCGAHTTASDALWAGLPLVTCIGHAFGGRVAASLLDAVGLPELITGDLQAYQALVLRLAGDRAMLAALREKLARNRLVLPLFDTARSRRSIEAAFTTMWDIFQRGEKPRGFSVAPIA